jgi:hypothetical protein
VIPADRAAIVAVPAFNALTTPCGETLTKLAPLATDHVNAAATGCPEEL